MLSVRTCEWCKQSFEAKVANKRFCGSTCFDAHRKDYGSKNVEARKVVRACKQCRRPYRRVYEKNGFCSISCGSKWHIALGTFNAWTQSNLGKRTGKTVTCDECGNPIYIVTHQFKHKFHYCDARCFGRHESKRFAGHGNPMFGRRLSEDSLAKQKRTLLQNHGVTNAYFLSKRRTTSKAQVEILSHLTGTLPNFDFEGEKFFSSGSHRYYIDIFSEQLKMVIEYNGDYWHCNPTHYSGSFFHPKKGKTASEIWCEDEKRLSTLEENGYRTFTVWETEYSRDRSGVLKRLVNTAISCSRIDANG